MVQISCERCGTTYALDERLIPAGGAPVQCTRCGHVFTAMPPGVPPRPETNKTQLFGSGTPAAAAPGAAGTSSRPPVPGAQAPAPSQERSSTQMFGVAGTPAPPAAIAPAAPAPADRHSTQMFGGQQPAAANAVAARPKPPSGSMQVQGQPAPNAARSTQMFGSALVSSTPAAERPSAQTFGSAPTPAQAPASAPGRRSEPTQMFGVAAMQGAEAPAAPERDPAQAFGAGMPGAGGAAPKSTQMFGTTSAPGAAPSAPQKPAQMFGVASVPAPSPSTPKPSQMSGSAAATAAGAGAGAPAPVSVPRPSSPLMPAPSSVPPSVFTAVTVPGVTMPAPPSDRAPTQLWTNPNAPAVPALAVPPTPAPPAPNLSAQIFGAVPMDHPPPPTPSPSLSTTQMFGAPGGALDGAAAAKAPSPVLPKILSSTPAPLPDESFADTVIRDRNRQPDFASTARTQAFGAPDEEELERVWAERSSRKNRFGMPDTTQPDVPANQRPDPTTIPEAPYSPAVTPVDSPQGSTPVDMPLFGPAPADTPVVSRLELPPEAPELIPEPRTEESHPMDEVVLRRQIQGRRTRLILAIAGVALLVVLGGIVGRVMARPKTVPIEITAQRDKVQLLLRRDDGQSRERAVSELVAMTSTYPEYIPAQADLVVALALQLDDERIQSRRLSAEADDLNRRIARLIEERSPTDWENRVAAMRARLSDISARANPMVEKVGVIDTQLNDRFLTLQALQPAGEVDQLAVARAQAIYSGVKGSDQAIILAERYKNLGGKDGWAGVALAELALNARVTPDAMNAAQAEMSQLSSKDSTFLRSYVLSARLSIAQKQGENAVQGLEAVLALNPAHEVARQLLESARSAEP
ncbi:MAG TPA: zinc-ribbon domain-containing protein [Myxococcales bacterium]|nr:zinc-ribbon domain-containing protein [Myxococcales bacterium]